MWQNAVTDGSIENLWPGSELQRYMLSSAVGTGIQGGQYFVWTILFLIFLGLILRRPFTVYFAWVGGFLKSPVRRTYSDTSPAVRYGLVLSLVVMIPVSAFLVYGTHAVAAPYYVILGCICAYFAIRFIVTSCIAYVSGEDGFVTVVNEPLLLSILYLCTLEILPIVIAVATILKF